MKFEETSAYRAHAAHCSHNAGLTKDKILKKFWDGLADDWMGLDSTILAVEARINASFENEKTVDLKTYAVAPKRRVVIIDDDPALAGILTTLVGGLGHDVVVKEDSSASHTYEVRDSDIVFVDLLMPKVSGVQVIEQLGRQNVKSAIVLMSGSDRHLHEAEQLVKKLDLDLLGVLHKPFQLPDVQSVLESA